MDLHAAALAALMGAGTGTPASREAVHRVATHGFNLFAAATGLVLRGCLDVSPHLVRGLLDCHCLAVQSARSESFATDVLRGKKQQLASKARKAVEESWRAEGRASDADLLASAYRDMNTEANGLAHVSAPHLSLTIGTTSGEPVLALGGRLDASEAQLQLLHLLHHELWMLTFFRACEDILPPRWVAGYETFRAGLRAFADRTDERYRSQ
jgi:hypothetical protein